MFTVKLEAADRPALREHFLALDAHDRYLRFGGSVGERAIAHYIEHIDFGRDALFGVMSDSRHFDGIAHLALDHEYAELGLSVLQHYRGRGIGTALVSRASVHARNRHINVLFMQCLSQNRAIMRIAGTLGMHVVTQGPDSKASMALSPASRLSIFSEWVDERIALCDAALRDTVLRRSSALPSVLAAAEHSAAA